MGTVEHLLRASYDLQPRAVATDYLAAAAGYRCASGGVRW